MTDAAADAPVATPRARKITAATVGVLLVAAVAGVLGSRSGPRAGGPLTGGDAGAIVEAFPAGSTVTFGMQTLGNDSPDADITIVSVKVRQGEPAVHLLGEPLLLGPERVEAMGFGSFDVLAGWPPASAPDTLPLEGVTIFAGAVSPYEVVVPLQVPSVEEGIGVIRGFTVEYDVDGHRYRDETDMALVICPVEEPAACQSFDPETDL